MAASASRRQRGPDMVVKDCKQESMKSGRRRCNTASASALQPSKRPALEDRGTSVLRFAYASLQRAPDGRIVRGGLMFGEVWGTVRRA